jgi:hypothetical protein
MVSDPSEPSTHDLEATVYVQDVPEGPLTSQTLHLTYNILSFVEGPVRHYADIGYALA